MKHVGSKIPVSRSGRPGGLLLAELPPPSWSVKKVRLIFPNFLTLKLAGVIFEYVRSDKMSRAETWLWWSRLQTRSLRWHRPAEHELPSARLNLPVLQCELKRLSGDSRTTIDARERNERQEGCASARQNFQRIIPASVESKHDSVILLFAVPAHAKNKKLQSQKQERETGKERRPFGS